jgi:hypothetical protein
VLQRDQSFAARSCLYDPETGEKTACGAIPPKTTPLRVTEAAVKEVVFPCWDYFEKQNLQIKPKDIEPNSVDARLAYMQARKQKLLDMGFNVK